MINEKDSFFNCLIFLMLYSCKLAFKCLIIEAKNKQNIKCGVKYVFPI